MFINFYEWNLKVIFYVKVVLFLYCFNNNGYFVIILKKIDF